MLCLRTEVPLALDKPIGPVGIRRQLESPSQVENAGPNCSNSPPVPQDIRGVGELRGFSPDSFRRPSGFLVNNRALHVVVTEDRSRSSVDPVDGN